MAIDGKMDTLNVFESTPLFRKLWPKLLKSYALDAVNAAEQAANQKPDPKAAKTAHKACGVDDARKFLAEVTQTHSGKATTNGDVAVTDRLDQAHFVRHVARLAAGERGERRIRHGRI